jgi:uncharacterized protein YbaA (DUF1428 family)
MSNYVDGFVLCIARKNLATYRRIARKASQVWREHGALSYVECAADDTKAPGMIPFPKLAKARADDVVIFAWAVFKSRRERDKANAAIMKDPRIAKMSSVCKSVVNCKRMAYGGFNVIVQL